MEVLVYFLPVFRFPPSNFEGNTHLSFACSRRSFPSCLLIGYITGFSLYPSTILCYLFSRGWGFGQNTHEPWAELVQKRVHRHIEATEPGGSVVLQIVFIEVVYHLPHIMKPTQNEGEGLFVNLMAEVIDMNRRRAMCWNYQSRGGPETG